MLLQKLGVPPVWMSTLAAGWSTTAPFPRIKFWYTGHCCQCWISFSVMSMPVNGWNCWCNNLAGASLGAIFFDQFWCRMFAPATTKLSHRHICRSVFWGCGYNSSSSNLPYWLQVVSKLFLFSDKSVYKLLAELYIVRMTHCLTYSLVFHPEPHIFYTYLYESPRSTDL